MKKTLNRKEREKPFAQYNNFYGKSSFMKLQFNMTKTSVKNIKVTKFYTYNLESSKLENIQQFYHKVLN